MAKRGPKPSAKARPRHPLGAAIPHGLTPAAREHYKRLIADVRAEGFASVIDGRAVALAAECAATVDALTKAVAELPSLVLADGNVHPALKELRAHRAQLQSLYGALLMTPRSRSSSRLSADQLRTQEGDDLGDFLGSD